MKGMEYFLRRVEVAVLRKERMLECQFGGEYSARWSWARLVMLAWASPARQKAAEKGDDVEWAMGSPQGTLK